MSFFKVILDAVIIIVSVLGFIALYFGDWSFTMVVTVPTVITAAAVHAKESERLRLRDRHREIINAIDTNHFKLAGMLMEDLHETRNASRT